uniref:Immunoglobulin domain-containing protein n=1 Tax=Sinocyclocheilus anshuiensis TaxID=1608454 RepID=A0A671K2N9_9TELE
MLFCFKDIFFLLVHTFHKTTPSNLSLLISNLSEDDQGTYRCTVNNKTSADTRLIVKGETAVLKSTQSLNELSMFLSVFLESLCRPAGCVLSEHHVTKSSYAGESVILPCSYSPHNLFLRISNLTETDGGLYVCSVNGKQSRHVTLTLTGKTPQISFRLN